MALLLATTSASAQHAARDSVSRRAGTALCPRDGISIGVEEAGARGSMRQAVTDSGTSTPLDTTIVFSVQSRTWRWTDVVAHVSAGASGNGRGATGAGPPSGTDGARWHLCAGAVAALRQATLTLQGASGAIRLRIDPSRLSRFTIPFDSAARSRP